jgi:iron complex transport system permease protein
MAARRLGLTLLLAGLTLAAAAVALAVGATDIGPFSALASLAGGGGREGEIVRALRLPRVVMGGLVGMGLAVAGTSTQALLRNPLASPFTLGIASGAGFGAVLAIYTWGGHSKAAVAGSAFALALATSLFTLAAARSRHARPETLILTGVAFMFLFSALSSFVQYVATMDQVYEMVFWHFGSLSKAGWTEIGLASVCILLPLPWFLRSSWDLNLLLAGDEAARSAGVDVGRLRTLGIVLAALVTAGAVCFTGVIGFIGLVAPHMARMLVGSDHRFLLPAAGCLGAALVLGADVLGRTLWPPQVVPIGIMTSFLGVPFFFSLLRSRRREYW